MDKEILVEKNKKIVIKGTISEVIETLKVLEKLKWR